MRECIRNSGAKVSHGVDESVSFVEQELTRRIIGCAISVHRALGAGYLELVYRNALLHELRKQGMQVQSEQQVKVLYDGVEVGIHRYDLLVESKVVLELKAVENLCDKHVAQIISTMKAVGVKIGLLMNFSEAKLVDGIRRVVL